MSGKQRFAISMADYLAFRKMRSLPKQVREKFEQLWRLCDCIIGCHDSDCFDSFRDSQGLDFFDSTLDLREVSVADDGKVVLQLVQSTYFSVPLDECEVVSDEDRKTIEKNVRSVGKYGETLNKAKLRRYEALARK
jgi:hypothetical protein